ncbi:hypothetical protein LINGRAHAP2_LOCUS19870 [Linum grandiflorum]
MQGSSNKGKGKEELRKVHGNELKQLIEQIKDETKIKSYCPQCKSTIMPKDGKTRLESCRFCSEGVPFPKDDNDLLEDRNSNKRSS